jgi:hypothetical protein
MANTKISQLPTFTGDASGSFILMNDSTNTNTWKITKETLLSNIATIGSNTFNGDQVISGSLYISGATELGGNIVPKSARGATLGTSDRPFLDIFVSSGSINIASDTPGDPNTTISNVGGNLLISAGGVKVLGNASFIAPTGSFGYISGSMIQVGNYTQTGNYNMTGNKTITGSLDVSGSIGLTNNLVFKNASTTTGSLGSLEYDGISFYGTPSSTERGVISTPQVYYNRSTSSLVNDGSQQSLLGLTNGVAVTGGVRYSYIIKTIVYASAANVNIFYANAGTATFSNTHYWADVGKTSFLGAFSPMTRTRTTLTTDGQIRDPKHISYGLTGECFWEIVLHGTLDVATSGYMKPIIQFSPIPGAGSYCLNGAYMEIYPIGASGANNTVIGTWS